MLYVQRMYVPIGGVTLVSKISYSLYLIHLPIVVYAASYTGDLELLSYRVCVYLITWITMIVVAYAMYRYYEYPMMCLRDKLNEVGNG